MAWTILLWIFGILLFLFIVFLFWRRRSSSLPAQNSSSSGGFISRGEQGRTSGLDEILPLLEKDNILERIEQANFSSGRKPLKTRVAPMKKRKPRVKKEKKPAPSLPAPQPSSRPVQKLSPPEKKIHLPSISFPKTKDPSELLKLIIGMDNDAVLEMLRNYQGQESKVQESYVAQGFVRDFLIQSKSKDELIKMIKDYLYKELQQSFQDLKNKLSNLRRKGTEVMMIELKMMSVPPKIKTFGLTGEKEALYSARKLMLEIEKEMQSFASPEEEPGDSIKGG